MDIIKCFELQLQIVIVAKVRSSGGARRAYCANHDVGTLQLTLYKTRPNYFILLLKIPGKG